MLLLLLPLLLAHGEPVPDYHDPYAPILLDRQSYTWTDRVVITIIAPSWNSDRHLVDSIGGDPGRAVTVSTGRGSLEAYRLAETGPDTGVFRAEVALTGFAHDADGDGRPDASPRTGGSGPSGGLLEAGRDTAVTVTFEFADGVILSESAPVSWVRGTVEFAAVSGSGGTVRVADRDMNLSPDAPDSVWVSITSGADAAGILVRATETSADSGVFEASFSTGDSSSGSRLRAPPGSQLSASYEDRTPPPPHPASAVLRAEAHARAGPEPPPLGLSPPRPADGSGAELPWLAAGEPAQLVGTVSNPGPAARDFAYILQVRGPGGEVVALSWAAASVGPGRSLEVSQPWVPAAPGTYRAESFAWRSLADPSALAAPASAPVAVR